MDSYENMFLSQFGRVGSYREYVNYIVILGLYTIYYYKMYKFL